MICANTLTLFRGAGKTVSAKFIMRYFASVNLDVNSGGAGKFD